MDQVHLRALLDDFLGNFAEFVRARAARSLATVAAWEELSPDGKVEAALATIARMAALDGPAPPPRHATDRSRNSATKRPKNDLH
jgi:hypothetical protein